MNNTLIKCIVGPVLACYLVILSCLGGFPAAAVGSPMVFLTPTMLLVQVLACYHTARIESIFQSIARIVQSPAFTLSHYNLSRQISVIHCTEVGVCIHYLDWTLTS